MLNQMRKICHKNFSTNFNILIKNKIVKWMKTKESYKELLERIILSIKYLGKYFD